MYYFLAILMKIMENETAETWFHNAQCESLSLEISFYRNGMLAYFPIMLM